MKCDYCGFPQAPTVPSRHGFSRKHVKQKSPMVHHLHDDKESLVIIGWMYRSTCPWSTIGYERLYPTKDPPNYSALARDKGS